MRAIASGVYCGFIFQMKIYVIFVLDFSLPILRFFLFAPSMDRAYPTCKIFHVEISHKIKKDINYYSP